MYRVLLERTAEKDLSRLSSEIRDRVIAAMQGLATDPRPPGCRKLTGSKNDWRVRVGDCRVLYEIGEAAREVPSTVCATAARFTANLCRGFVRCKRAAIGRP